MIGYECASCGTIHSADAVKKWGRTRESSGYGPHPRCTELVDAEFAPRASDGSVPKQLCGGPLVAVDAGDDEKILRQPTLL